LYYLAGKELEGRITFSLEFNQWCASLLRISFHVDADRASILHLLFVPPAVGGGTDGLYEKHRL
jgi:hypothetical protein